MKYMVAPELAHELRTPIAASKTLAQLALRTQDINQCHEYLQDIVEGLDRAALIITQIQLITGLHPEQVLDSRSALDLRSMMSAVVHDLSLISDKKLHIDNLVPEGTMVFADKGCMLIVLRNLLDNAIRYSGDEPKISVTALQEGEHVMIAVTDQGPGIPPESRTRVLERFYREPGTGQSGSGLGLSIVAQICALHGGSISLTDGDDGKGLKVIVNI